MLSETKSWYEREECQDGKPGGPYDLPDLTDAATLGCLLALVREAWKDPALCALRELCGDWCWSVGRGEVATALRGQAATTEAEALVMALEAAP